MEFIKVDYQQFVKNKSWLKNNMAFLYDLYNWPENKERKRSEIKNNFFTPYKDFFEKHKETAFLIIGKEDNKMYSCCMFNQENDNVWYLDSVYTHFSKRRQGISTKMINYGLHEINGICYLHVKEGHLPAISLYQKLGFKKDDSHLIESIQGRIIMAKQVSQVKNDIKEK